MKKIQLLFLFLGFFFIASLAQSTDIDLVYQKFTTAYANYDSTTIAELYTEDALYLSPGGEIEVGRDLLVQGFAGMFRRAKSNGEQLDISFKILKREVIQSTAYDVGYYHLVRTSEQGVRKSTGKFITILEKNESGMWQFTVDGYSKAPNDVFD